MLASREDPRQTPVSSIKPNGTAAGVAFSQQLPAVHQTPLRVKLMVHSTETISSWVAWCAVRTPSSEHNRQTPQRHLSSALLRRRAGAGFSGSRSPLEGATTRRYRPAHAFRRGCRPSLLRGLRPLRSNIGTTLAGRLNAAVRCTRSPLAIQASTASTIAVERTRLDEPWTFWVLSPILGSRLTTYRFAVGRRPTVL